MDYIEITRKQVVRVPLIEGADIFDIKIALKRQEIFDLDNSFDFDKEEVIDEDYSASESKICINGFEETVPTDS